MGCDNPGSMARTGWPIPLFDNDTTALNGAGSNGSAAHCDLTPNASYTCKVKDTGGR